MDQELARVPPLTWPLLVGPHCCMRMPRVWTLESFSQLGLFVSLSLWNLPTFLGPTLIDGECGPIAFCVIAMRNARFRVLALLVLLGKAHTVASISAASSVGVGTSMI